ncbi:hypothetical protein [Cellulomonas denverensis]|uniref:Gram-positive cocci surface proteins LPxTG domain-containing protein n=1 Tax=Cellulomonas denverensis TaxID=264297 RepID=A0A7X6R0F7_9CELL|nr:hypothetical protein [Cellulomonas denverensis]NKY24264.1 hypothetical protein [Cellulomonas denverensis]GIG26739.1 hypothetical protein Cde04nite_29830 [Cellulomonas denverensis]
MTIRRTATTTVATVLALAVTGVFAGGAAQAAESPEIPAVAVDDPGIASSVAEPGAGSAIDSNAAAEPDGSGSARGSGAAAGPVAAQPDAAPQDALVAPLPEDPATDGTGQAATNPAPADAPEADSSDDAAPVDAAPVDDPAPATDEASAASTEPTDPTDADVTEPADAADVTDPATDALATPASAATALAAAPSLRASATAADIPATAYDHLWIDNGCDYWYFLETAGAESGRAWEGWSGQPQIHFLFHEIQDAEGQNRIVYDRDIQDSWYHPRTEWVDDGTGTWVPQPTVGQDIDGMHWENGPAQQTVVFNGYKGGADDAAKRADARALFERAGVDYRPFAYTAEQRASLLGYGYTDEQIDAMERDTNDYQVTRAAYEATQFAVWYFSTGHDVMGLFFQVDDAGHVTLTDKALQQFVPDSSDGSDWTRNWGEYSQGRMETMTTAAWLIENALATHVVAPQPGFVAAGATTDADGSTRYGFAVTLVGGAGTVDVELRTADGSPVPAGVILVDGHGNPVTTVHPGDLVYVRVPAGVDVSTLPAFQVWGSAVGTQQGTPDYFTGDDHSHRGYWDEETQQWLEGPSAIHHLIGLGSLDQPTVGRDWIAVDLSSLEPGGDDDPTDDPSDDPTDDPGTDPATDPGTDPAVGPTTVDPATVTPAAAVDPIVAPLSSDIPAAADPAGIGTVALATTGGEAGTLIGVSFLLVAAGATGLVLRRRATR